MKKKPEVQQSTESIKQQAISNQSTSVSSNNLSDHSADQLSKKPDTAVSLEKPKFIIDHNTPKVEEDKKEVEIKKKDQEQE